MTQTTLTPYNNNHNLFFDVVSLFPSSKVIKLFEYYKDDDYKTIASNSNSLDDIAYNKKYIVKIKCINGLFYSIYVNNVLILKDR